MKMRKSLIPLVSYVAFASSLCAYSETYTNDTVKTGDSITNTDIKNASGNVINLQDNTLDLTINLAKDSSVGAGDQGTNFFWKQDADVSLKSLTIDTNTTNKSSGVRLYLTSTYKNSSFNIAEDFHITLSNAWSSIIGISSSLAPSVAGPSFYVGGSVTTTSSSNGIRFGDTTSYGALASFIVQGNVTGSVNAIRVVKQSSNYDETKWANAGVHVKGIFTSDIAMQFNLFASAVDTGHRYYQFGGINQGADISLTTSRNSERNYTNIMITGDIRTSLESESDRATSAEMSGSVIEAVANTDKGHYATLIMNSSADFTQKFSGAQLDFEKVTIQRGKLLMNYTATGSHTTGTLVLKGEGATNTVFGNSDEQSYGNFVFNSIEVSGDGSIKIQSSRDGSTFVAGENYDLLTATNGMSGAGDVKFEFDNASNFVSDSKDGLYRVIAWTDNSESFNVADYKDIIVSGSDYSGFDFVHEFKNDGLYVAYVAASVPEPSTYAIILGMLALGLATWRKRK